jgi:hypothetical protein
VTGSFLTFRLLRRNVQHTCKAQHDCEKDRDVRYAIAAVIDLLKEKIRGVFNADGPG